MLLNIHMVSALGSKQVALPAMWFAVRQRSPIQLLEYSGSWCIKVDPFGLDQKPARYLQFRGKREFKETGKGWEKPLEKAGSLVQSPGFVLSLSNANVPTLEYCPLKKCPLKFYHLMRVWAYFFPVGSVFLMTQLFYQVPVALSLACCLCGESSMMPGWES